MKLDPYLKRGWHVEYHPVLSHNVKYLFYHEDWISVVWTAESIDEVIERIEEYEDEQNSLEKGI